MKLSSKQNGSIKMGRQQSPQKQNTKHLYINKNVTEERKKKIKKDELFVKQIVETKATAVDIYRNTNQKFVLVAGSKNYN